SNSQCFVKSVSKKLKDLLIGTSVTNDFRNTEFENLINSIIERLDELKSNESLRFEYELKENDSERIFLIDLSYHITQNGIEKIQGVVTDITYIKLNERRLQKLNNDKNRLLSIVSHDLKAPFNTILNFINLLNDGIELDEEQRKEYLKYIYDTTKQQLELIHDLLDWSKVEAGLLEFSPNFIQLNYLVGKVLSGFSGQIYQKKIQVIQEFDKNLKVFFDRNYLKIVLSNILSNAIKFSHRDSKIIISARDEGDFTTITIQDFGIGFSEKYFKQLSQSHNFNLQIGTMGEKGTGFGLKFCYDIITSNNGKIIIESKSQKGTKVKIKLPNPKVVGLYFGDEDEINALKNYSNKIQPDCFLYLCKDIFDFSRFSEENDVNLVFVKLDTIKTFQHSFLEKVFSGFSEECKVIGFGDNPEELQILKSIIRIDEIEKSTRIEGRIKRAFRELLQAKNNDSFSKSDKYHSKTENESHS
ncbi:MAG: sensor histidine kinase, partial [Ignavibacteria bacterium]